MLVPADGDPPGSQGLGLFCALLASVSKQQLGLAGMHYSRIHCTVRIRGVFVG